MRWLYIKKWHYWWISTNWCVFEHWKYGSIMKFYLAPVRWKILYNQTQELWIYGLYYTPNFLLLRLSMSKLKKTVVTGTLPTLMITTEIVITWRNLHSIFSFNVQSLTVFDSKFFSKAHLKFPMHLHLDTLTLFEQRLYIFLIQNSLFYYIIFSLCKFFYII